MFGCEFVSYFYVIVGPTEKCRVLKIFIICNNVILNVINVVILTTAIIIVFFTFPK